MTKSPRFLDVFSRSLQFISTSFGKVSQPAAFLFLAHSQILRSFRILPKVFAAGRVAEYACFDLLAQFRGATTHQICAWVWIYRLGSAGVRRHKNGKVLQVNQVTQTVSVSSRPNLMVEHVNMYSACCTANLLHE